MKINFEDRYLERLEKFESAIPLYAKAKSERVYIEQYRKSKKAMLMGECKLKTVSERENYAYSHPEYIQLLDGLKWAVEMEEKCKWALEKLRIEKDVWQTLQANQRQIRV